MPGVTLLDQVCSLNSFAFSPFFFFLMARQKKVTKQKKRKKVLKKSPTHTEKKGSFDTALCLRRQAGLKGKDGDCLAKLQSMIGEAAMSAFGAGARPGEGFTTRCLLPASQEKNKPRSSQLL